MSVFKQPIPITYPQLPVEALNSPKELSSMCRELLQQRLLTKRAAKAVRSYRHAQLGKVLFGQLEEAHTIHLVLLKGTDIVAQTLSQLA